MVIKAIDANDNAYCDLVARCGTIFNDPSWLAMYGEKLALLGIYNGDNLIGSFHIYKEKKVAFSFFKNPPFTPHIGLVVDAKSKNVAKALSENKKVIAVVADYLDSLSTGVVSCAFPSWASDMQPLIWKKFKVIPAYTYHSDLTSSETELEERMAAEHRNLLKKAIKDGLKCSLTADYSQVKSLVLKTFDRKEKGVDQKMLDAILSNFANVSNSFAYVAEENGKPIAAAFCIFDKKRAYYMLSGYDPAAKHGGAGIMCVWNCILHAKQLGLLVFDFEGSMLPEVERYFRGFGPAQIPYYTVNKAWLPLEMMLKFIKREQF